jgi:hypothetical protein
MNSPLFIVFVPPLGANKNNKQRRLKCLKIFALTNWLKSFIKNEKKLKLKEPLRDQFERATLSIVLNLAEGRGKLLICADRLGANIYKLILSPGGSS